ncbi:flagellar protein FlaG [Natribacillus halophilus]|uniref:Flagellar protein FlaG n=1 Tax=Natribacillus halophilus TaxID=549003 RepID=A0A1G8KQ21_9BACI|nr:flagellar protein FlaG [Natribacillus halophilus]SDI44970.1 flagellar protein FlaG [Natribacillus halophilus]
MHSSQIPSTGAEATFHLQRFKALANEHAQLQDKKRDVPDRGQIDAYVEEMNGLLETTPTSLRFNIHEDLGRIHVHVIDRFSEDVLREVPPEKLLDMTAAILKQVGLIVDEQL